MSHLTEFYRGNRADGEGRTLAQLWAMSHDQWEDRHDFIQWLFPLQEPSRFNARAPILTDDDVAEFRAEAQLRDNLRRSFTLFLDFLGLRLEGSQVVRTSEFDARGVFDFPNHNWLRVTRVLSCTRLLGLEMECRALFGFLDRLHTDDGGGVTDDSYRYWRQASLGDR